MGVKALTGPEPLLCFPLACLGVRFIVRGMKMNPRFTLFVATVFALGTFALQGHDPGSTIRYRNIRVKRLD